LFFTFLVSPCDSVSCQNEGTCSVEAGLAVCCCKGLYSGTTCEGENFSIPKKLYKNTWKQMEVTNCKLHWTRMRIKWKHWQDQSN
jgi:hypothetical protein